MPGRALSNQSTPPPTAIRFSLSHCPKLDANSIPMSFHPQVEIDNLSVKLGSIASVRLPHGWRATQSESSCRLRPAADPSVCVKFVVRSQMMDSAIAANFRQLLAAKPANTRAEVLLPSEIRAVSDMLGVAAINQHVLSQGYGFKLTHAATVCVNAKTMLEIRGTFVTSNGQIISDFQAYYFEVGKSGIVQEIILDGKFMQLARLNGDIKQLLNSISWVD